MRRALTAVAALLGAVAHASDLGSDGRLRFAPDAIATLGFEDASNDALRVRTLGSNGTTWTYNALTPSALNAHLVMGMQGLEGLAYLHWASADGQGIAYMDPALFATLTGRRISVSCWGRAEGMEPYLTVTYGTDAELPTDRAWALARIPAIRTGRETSDGWVEYSTGPIDGAVLGAPIHDITLSGRIPSASDTTLRLNAKALHTTDAVSIDAIEIRPEPGAPSTAACTAMTADADCGAAGECFYGQCVDAAVAWHAVPPKPMQTEIATRVAAWATMFEGDRAVWPRADAAWVTGTLALASDTATPKTFWRALSQRIEELRDTHTHLGGPYVGISNPMAVRPTTGSGPLGVCFGATLDDFNGNALSYVVWHTDGMGPPVFQVGDVVTAIDGVDPKAWVDVVLHRYNGALPVDPHSDWSNSANRLSWLLTQHAKTLSFKRCTSGGACTPQPDFDVASYTQSRIGVGAYTGGKLTCRARFTDVIPGAHSDPEGGDLVLSGELDGGVLGIELDGFTPTTQAVWKTGLDTALALMPRDRIIVDARQGHGGKDSLGNYLVQHLRGTESPVSLVIAGRSGYDVPDAPWLFSFDWSTCVPPQSFQCSTTFFFLYGPNVMNPPGAAARVAWLNTDDLSNNDMVPLLLQGRPNLTIFGPWPTYGAIGGDEAIPPLMPDWTSGTIAIGDTRYGTDPSSAELSSVWHSGAGVPPDVVVTQTLSDALAGQDTILNAAMSWVLQ
jgi:hypothetical protein